MTPVSYSPRLDVVADVVSRAIARWPADAARIERGASLLILGAVAPLTPTSWGVRSASDAGVVYAVTLTSCTCRDPHPACKHRWAADLLVISVERQQRLDRAAAERVTRARFTADAVALSYARAIGFPGVRP